MATQKSGEGAAVNVQVPVTVLERLIASGALCAADICCLGLADKQQVSAICKRCCARRGVGAFPS